MKTTSFFKTIFILLFSVSSLMSSCSNKPSSGSEGPSKNVSATGENKEAVSSSNKSNSDTSVNWSEWPCFHGLDRQNKSVETDLLKTWPEDGPELEFSIEGLGEGYSSVSIADGTIFTAGASDNQTFVFAYDLNGNLIWKKPNGEAWKVQVSWASAYNGPRSTPTYDNGIVYHMSEASRLAAFDAKTGEEIWARVLANDFDADTPEYGFTESVIVDGDRLFVRPAGKRGFQICLNKLSGETIWVNNEIPGTYSYNSPVIHDFGGFHQLINASSNCYFGIDTENGKLLWKYDFTNQYDFNSIDPVVHNEYVLASGSGVGSELIKLKSNGSGITTEKVWETDLMDNYHGGIIYHDGCFYGSGDRRRGWFSLSLEDGQQMWKEQGMGSLTFADGELYLLGEKGTMKLVDATADAFEEKGEFKLPRGGAGPYWAHPVVCGGRLYIRHADRLFVYNVK